MNGTKTETTQRVEYKEKKIYSTSITYDFITMTYQNKKIITLNIRTRNNSSQLIERRCFDVPKAKKKTNQEYKRLMYYRVYEIDT